MKSAIVKTLYYIFTGAAVLIALLVLISAFPIAGNYQIKVVQSGSMEPAIKTGAVVVIVPSDTYEVGDVVNFDGGFRSEKGEGISITHRIIEKNKKGTLNVYKTKGDGNDDPDTNELMDQKIIGKVAFSIPYAGYLVEAARRPYGFLAIVIIPAGIIIYEQVAVIRAEIKKIRAKRKPDLQNG